MLSAAATTQFESARALLLQGRLAEAARACQQMCERFPRFVEGWQLASTVARQLGELDAAAQLIDRAAALEPANSVVALQKARLLEIRGDRASARALAAQAERTEPKDSRLCLELAGFHSLCNDHARALPYYRRASVLDPGNAQNWFNLASTERFAGRFEAAETAFDEALRRTPGHVQAQYLRSGLRTQTRERNHVEELKALLGRSAQWSDQFQLCYALAKELEDLQDYAQSFEYLTRGAQLRRQHMTYEVEEEVAAMDAISRTYCAEVFAGLGPGHHNSAPVFVVGLPRTGTTLVERILGSHSKVFAAGELNQFAVQMTAALQTLTNRSASKLEAIAASVKLDFAALGRAFLDGSRACTGQRAHFTDKTPQNFLYCGLIAAALPAARIVEVVRHPMDSCYAMYKQLFTMAYPFSYDLGDLALYFSGYRRLMQHWHALMPGRILTVRYEDVVANQQAATRRLLEHCGLEWEDNCLEFDRNAQSTTTASAVQVRQKIYESSVGKWERFRRQLQPLADGLRATAEGRAALRDYGE
jgi:tetratricopeptide (TPR) repeat protein